MEKVEKYEKLGESQGATQRLIDQITKAGPGTLAAGAKLSTKDVWTVLNYVCWLELELKEEREWSAELKQTIDRLG